MNDHNEKLTDAQRSVLKNAQDTGVWHAACDALRLLDEATARAEAAERDAEKSDWEREERVTAAESEAAALRAEVERLLAQVERVLTQSEAHQSSLAAATALLGTVRDELENRENLKRGTWAQLEQFVDSTPTPRERAAAERRVLEACAEWRISRSEHGEDCHIYTDDQYKIAKAELALRALLRQRAAAEHCCGVSGWRPDLGDAPCPACDRYLALRAVKS